MLTFNLEEGKQIQMDREPLEMKILEGIFNKLDQARTHDKGMYTILKQAVNMVISFANVDIKIPKGENSLEYLLAHYVSLGMDVLEKEPLAVNGKVVEPDVQTN